MLLLCGVSVFVSCNSYDVEGKPEIASNPAKKVFANYPWEKAEEKTDEEKPADTGDTGTDTGDTGTDTGDTGTDTGDTGTDTGDTGTDTVDTGTDTADTDSDPTGADTDSDTDTDTDTDTDAGASIEDSGVVVKKSYAPVIVEEFEIYNRGVTGELKIKKINMLDPEGNLIAALDTNNEKFKELFQLQVQKMEKGIAVKDTFGEKGLTFDFTGDNKDDAIAALCPLSDDNDDEKADGKSTKITRKCKDGFDSKKYNSEFSIRLSYSKDAADSLAETPSGKREFGNFWIEICTNDPSKGTSDTCGKGYTSYKIQVTRQANKPPKPIIHVEFESPINPPMSYRNILDKVQMNLAKTCVRDPDAPEKDKKCLEDWEKRYYIQYKWEMVETPTPFSKESQLSLIESEESAGTWIPDDGKRANPKRASFKGLNITPVTLKEAQTVNDAECKKCGKDGLEPQDNGDPYYFEELSKYLRCRQKYCEPNKTKYYQISIQAETVDKETELVSDTEEIIVVPKIIPQARVVAQLSWDQGFKTKAESESKEGTTVDIDIHMIKKNSIEALQYGFNMKDGLLGTRRRTEDLDETCPLQDASCEIYWRHDDCSFGDKGDSKEEAKQGRTIQWHASLDIDDTWGGGNYTNPETIGLGPIEDKIINATGEKGQDGIPDVDIYDDQYLVVVGYVNCESKYGDGQDRCSEEYSGEDKASEVDARVQIFVDGTEAPRQGKDGGFKDNYSETSRDFKIKLNEWKVVAVVKWDSSLPGPDSNPLYKGDAIVSDIAMREKEIVASAKDYPVCTFDNTYAELIPVWDVVAYENYITKPQDENNPNFIIGSCKGGSTPDTGDTGDTGTDTGDTGTDTGDTGTDTGDTDTTDTDTTDTGSGD